MMGDRTISLKDYETVGILGFTTIFCKDCVYNPLSYGMAEHERSEAARECNECMPDIGRLYRNKQPLRIKQDGNGKNIAEILEE
jgi:hypothetical protein